jgi:hypothetical protein
MTLQDINLQDTNLQDELREAAATCLKAARSTIDAGARARLLLLAQKFHELASGTASNAVLAKLLDEFNDAQMIKPSPCSS